MNRNIRLLYIHNFLSQFRFQTAYLVIFFNQILGSYTAAMTILDIENVTSAVMDVPTGIMSDYFGRRKILAFGSLCSAVGVGRYAFADDAAWLVAGALLNGLSSCLFNGNNNALLYETLRSEGLEKEFHHAQGRTSSMFQLALGIAALCSSLMTTQGLRFIFIMGIIPQILAIGVSLLFEEPCIHTHAESHGIRFFKSAFRQIWQNPRLRLLTLGQAISYGAGEATFNFRNAFIAQLWPVWALGIYRSLNNAGGFVGFWFAGRVIDRLKAPYVLVLSEVYWFVSNIIAVLIANPLSPVIFLTGAVPYGPCLVAQESLMQAEFADQQRATMSSVASFMGSLFYAVMAFCIGGISDHTRIAYGMAFGIAVSSLALPVYMLLFRRHFSVLTCN